MPNEAENPKEVEDKRAFQWVGNGTCDTRSVGKEKYVEINTCQDNYSVKTIVKALFTFSKE